MNKFTKDVILFSFLSLLFVSATICAQPTEKGLILKWENIADQKHSNRWLILIAYLMGLSIGVHLLNLLAVPAIVFVYYFKKYNVSKKAIEGFLIWFVVLFLCLVILSAPSQPILVLALFVVMVVLIWYFFKFKLHRTL